MPDLNFRVEGAAPDYSAAGPLLRFTVRIAETGTAPIHTAILRCQVHIEPARRRYAAEEEAGLVDLFGAPERWGQTMRPLLWTHAVAVVPSFTGSVAVDVPVPCGGDFNVAAVRYFGALNGGEAPLCFLFSGTVFYEADDGALQAAPIAWEKEATYRLPVAAWKELMDHYYPNGVWLSLRKDLFDRLGRYGRRQGLPSWEQALERLLSAAEGPD